MSDLDTKLSNQFKDESDYQASEYKRGYDRIEHLENMLKKEREDRIRSLDEQLAPIHDEMDLDFVNLEAERTARVQKEREILENLAENARKIEEAILTEKEERQEQQGELMNKLNTELKRQRDRINQIKTDTIGEFEKDSRDINKEMDNRYEHQDRTVKDISHFISTFQKTLKAVGGKEEDAT